MINLRLNFQLMLFYCLMFRSFLWH